MNGLIQLLRTDPEMCLTILRGKEKWMGPIPKEIEDLFALFEPYFVEDHLENAPQEAIEAYEKAVAWAFGQGQ